MIENTINRMEDFHKDIITEIQRKEAEQKKAAENKETEDSNAPEKNNEVYKLDESIMEKANREQLERVAKDEKMYVEVDFSKVDEQKIQQTKDAFDSSRIDYEKVQQLLS